MGGASTGLGGERRGESRSGTKQVVERSEEADAKAETSLVIRWEKRNWEGTEVEGGNSSPSTLT
jgi:hypothetical protein